MQTREEGARDVELLFLLHLFTSSRALFVSPGSFQLSIGISYRTLVIVSAGSPSPCSRSISSSSLANALSRHIPPARLRSLSPRLGPSLATGLQLSLPFFLPSSPLQPCLAPLAQDGASRAPPACSLALPLFWQLPLPSCRLPCLSLQETKSCLECVGLPHSHRKERYKTERAPQVAPPAKGDE